MKSKAIMLFLAGVLCGCVLSAGAVVVSKRFAAKQEPSPREQPDFKDTLIRERLGEMYRWSMLDGASIRARNELRSIYEVNERNLSLRQKVMIQAAAAKCQEFYQVDLKAGNYYNLPSNHPTWQAINESAQQARSAILDAAQTF